MDPLSSFREGPPFKAEMPPTSSLTGPDSFGHQRGLVGKSFAPASGCPLSVGATSVAPWVLGVDSVRWLGVGLSGGWLTLVDPCLVFFERKWHRFIIFSFASLECFLS